MTAAAKRQIDEDGESADTKGMETPGGLRESLRRRLQAIAQSYHEDEHDSLDVYRTLQHEASLLFHTQRVKDHLTSDPFERFQDPPLRAQLDRLSQSVQVTQLDHVATAAGYVLIEAAVDIAPLAASKSNTDTHRRTGRNPLQQKPPQSISLRCRYEREAMGATDSPGPCSVRYSIDLCHDPCGPTEPLLWVQVFASGSAPSPNGAKCLDDEGGGDNDDADGWSDMEDDDNALDGAEVGESGLDKERGSKRSKSSAEVPQASDLPDATEASSASSASSAEPRDRFTAGIDPEVLQSFVDGIQFGDVDEATAFFLLMSFPFYEHEWDLVGFVLDSVFGTEDDDEDEDEDGSDEDESVKESSSQPTRPGKHGRKSG